MKKLLLLLMVLCYAFSLIAATKIKSDTVKKDTAKINRKIKSLNDGLADLKSQLTAVQNKIPTDSTNLENLKAKSRDAQIDSKKAAKNSVGGDVSDAKKAEKKAKEAADATNDTHDAQSQLDDDRKKFKKLTKQIKKDLDKLNDLQGQL